jgi:hypothetical protein
MFINIIAIGWVYVVLLMSLTEVSITAGIMTFLFYCVLPLSLLLYILRAGSRKKARKATKKQLPERQLASEGSESGLNKEDSEKTVNPSK